MADEMGERLTIRSPFACEVRWFSHQSRANSGAAHEPCANASRSAGDRAVALSEVSSSGRDQARFRGGGGGDGRQARVASGDGFRVATEEGLCRVQSLSAGRGCVPVTCRTGRTDRYAERAPPPGHDNAAIRGPTPRRAPSPQ
ncbi:hypothetical protein GCM10023238_32060 [Streptomyces heliomycini]